MYYLFLRFTISRFRNSQSSRRPQRCRRTRSQIPTSSLFHFPGIKYIARSPCCHLLYFIHGAAPRHWLEIPLNWKHWICLHWKRPERIQINGKLVAVIRQSSCDIEVGKVHKGSWGLKASEANCQPQQSPCDVFGVLGEGPGWDLRFLPAAPAAVQVGINKKPHRHW